MRVRRVDEPPIGIHLDVRRHHAEDTIAIFRIDEGNGRMTPVSTVRTGGRGPREMNFEPSGKYFYVCNQQSGDVAIFSVDADTGQITQGSKVDLPLAGVISFALI